MRELTRHNGATAIRLAVWANNVATQAIEQRDAELRELVHGNWAKLFQAVKNQQSFKNLHIGCQLVCTLGARSRRHRAVRRTEA